MYLKVYYGPNGRDATVAQVQSALEKAPSLTVTNQQDYIAIEFPSGASWPEREHIRKVLNNKGFETED